MASFWDEIKDVMYDAMENEFYTEAEREDIIADQFSSLVGFTDDVSTIPSDFKARSATFFDPVSLIIWIEDGAIPLTSIYVHRYLEGRITQNVKYRAYISPNS